MIPDRDEISRHLFGETTRARSEEIEALAARDPRVREAIEEEKRLLRDLGAAPAELEQLDLVAAVREEIARAPAVPPRTTRGTRVIGALAAVAAAALFAITVSRPKEDELRAKSGGATGEERWSGIQLFRARGDALEGRVSGTLRPGDGLLVAYLNGGPKPYAYLMVFAVDARGRTFWLYPEHSSPGRDPRSIPVSASASPVELPDRVVHDFERGPLAVYGVFTREPLAVSTIEALVHAPFDAARAKPLPLPGAAQQVIGLVVE